MEILPGRDYRHFKGNIYHVLYLAKHTENGEELVIYVNETIPEKIWARPVSHWNSPAMVDGKEVARFTLLPKTDE